MDSRTDLNYESIQIALDRAAYLEKWGGPYNNADMVNVQVLAAEVQRLRAKLNTIAFPRRGSPEAGWGVEEIGRFAAEGLEPSQAGVNKDATTVRQASPAELRAAYNSGVADHSQLSGVMISDYVGKLLEAEARRRYPDTAGEASRDEEESSKRADDLANAFVGGTHFMATNPDCTTDQVFAEANRRYSAEL